MKLSKRQLLIGILAILGIAGIVLASIFLATHRSGSANIPTVTSPKETIDYLSKPTTVSGLNADFSGKKIDAPTIFYKANDKDYAVKAVASEGYLYTANQLKRADDSFDIHLNIANVFNGLGFTRTVESTNYNNEATLYDTFEKDSLVCQSGIMTTNPYENQTYSFVCSDKTSLAKAYDNVDPLISLYRKTATLQPFNSAVLTSETKDDVSYGLVRLSDIQVSETDTTNKTLLFGAVKGNWEYLGELSSIIRTGASAGQYDLSASLKAKITQPKYGTFILDSINERARPSSS